MESHIDLSHILPRVHVGKVRETYEIPGYPHLLLVVATDRVSTHNVVHASLIPGKGEVLTAFTVFWLAVGPLKDFPHHLVASGRCIYGYLPSRIEDEFPDIHYRAIVVRKLDMVPVEFVYRSRLTGSLKKAYDQGEDPYGLALPPGLLEMSLFPQGTIFTPTRKSKNDPPRRWRHTVRQFPTESLLTTGAYATARHYLYSIGIELVDSKMEVGWWNGICYLADELFTLDSSRLVFLTDVRVGVAPPWYDKQVLRDLAEQIWGKGEKYPLEFSNSAIEATSQNYGNMLGAVTHTSLEQWQNDEFYDFDLADTT